jgi:N-acetyltransferase 10
MPVYPLVKCAKTVDQAKALLTFIDAASEKTLRSTVALTAARGRGKSAALGLSMAAAVAHGYSNIFVTSPSPENLKTLFSFVFKGFDALGYVEHLDYAIHQSTHPSLAGCIVRVSIFRTHRQTIQYVAPQDAHVLSQAELVVIDEAAAIPLPMVKAMMGNWLVFMASTINGYEGTGRGLSLKLLKGLREETRKAGDANMGENLAGRVLRGVSEDLGQTCRYHPNNLQFVKQKSSSKLRSGTLPMIPSRNGSTTCFASTAALRARRACFPASLTLPNASSTPSTAILCSPITPFRRPFCKG